MQLHRPLKIQISSTYNYRALEQAPLINEPDFSVFKGNLHKGYITGASGLISALCSLCPAAASPPHPKRRGKLPQPPSGPVSTRTPIWNQPITQWRQRNISWNLREGSLPGCDQQHPKRIRFSPRFACSPDFTFCFLLPGGHRCTRLMAWALKTLGQK